MPDASDAEFPTNAGAAPVPPGQRYKYDVFISYSSHDKTITDAVCQTLESHGLRCWIAPRDIVPGSDWAESILDGLDVCQTFVLVFTSSANNSIHVLREVARAFGNRIVVIPFRVEDIQPSRKLQYWISQSHWLDAMTEPLQQHLDRLVQVVRSNLVPPRPESEAAPRVVAPIPPLGDTHEITLPGGVMLNMLWCPPGTFLMGSPTSEAGHCIDEKQVSVTLTKGFWLGQTVVTQAMWTAVMEERPWLEHGDKSYYKVGSDYPAVYVDHTDATAFCDELTKIEREANRLPTGWMYALPTEAQWEYACRAGTTTAYSFSDDVGRLGQYAWFNKNAWEIGEQYAHTVATKKVNPWGFYDLHGNVWEWCRDGYEAKLPGGRDPFVSPAGAANQVRRGGSGFLESVRCRSAHRYELLPKSRYYDLGFRLATVDVGQAVPDRS